MSNGLPDIKHRIRERLDWWWKEGPTFPNPWHKVGPVSFYMRKTPVVVNGVRHDSALTIASVTIRQDHQRKGLCAEIFHWMAEQKDATILIAESVLSCRMEAILVKQGWHIEDEEARRWYLEVPK